MLTRMTAAPGLIFAKAMVNSGEETCISMRNTDADQQHPEQSIRAAVFIGDDAAGKITDRERQQREANHRCPHIERRTEIRRDHSRGEQLDSHHRRAFEHGKQINRASYSCSSTTGDPGLLADSRFLARSLRAFSCAGPMTAVCSFPAKQPSSGCKRRQRSQRQTCDGGAQSESGDRDEI